MFLSELVGLFFIYVDEFLGAIISWITRLFS